MSETEVEYEQAESMSISKIPLSNTSNTGRKTYDIFVQS